METFSASLAICAGNSPVLGEFPAQGPVGVAEYLHIAEDCHSDIIQIILSQRLKAVALQASGFQGWCTWEHNVVGEAENGNC